MGICVFFISMDNKCLENVLFNDSLVLMLNNLLLLWLLEA